MEPTKKLNSTEILSIKRRHAKGSSIAEIAEILSCSIEAVKEVLKTNKFKGR